MTTIHGFWNRCSDAEGFEFESATAESGFSATALGEQCWFFGRNDRLLIFENDLVIAAGRYFYVAERCDLLVEMFGRLRHFRLVSPSPDRIKLALF